MDTQKDFEMVKAALESCPGILPTQTDRSEVLSQRAYLPRWYEIQAIIAPSLAALERLLRAERDDLIEALLTEVAARKLTHDRAEKVERAMRKALEGTS